MPLDSNAWFERPLDVPLPRGGGQIVDASGQTQTFQFQPPTEEAAAAALHSAAQEERMFNAQRAAAVGEAEDRQFMQDLLQNARTASAARVVDMAMQFQEMRAYERERSLGMASGLSPELASIRALSRHPRAVGGGTGAASMMRALAPAPQIEYGTTPSGMRYLSRDGNIQFEPGQATKPVVEKPPITLDQRLRYWQERVKDLQDELMGPEAAPGTPQEAEVKAALDEARRSLKEAEKAMPKLGSQQSTLATKATGTINPPPKSKDELVVGQLYQSPRGVLRWNGTRFELEAD